ncbi:MAG: sporulation protein YabP [Clostridiales bacterium]|nr:sporulation protein YabP [Clostridiales bacterium]
MSENISKCQTIYLENRNLLKMNCVESVLSLNETEVNLLVNNQTLNIKGSELKAEKLCVETGELVLVGNINSLKFEEKKQKQPLLKRLFK